MICKVLPIFVLIHSLTHLSIFFSSLFVKDKRHPVFNNNKLIIYVTNNILVIFQKIIIIIIIFLFKKGRLDLILNYKYQKTNIVPCDIT